MTDPQEFKHNHYVPEWYQRRFMLPGQNTYWYLDLRPDPILKDGQVIAHRRDLLAWGPRKCFAESDLYTIRWGAQENRDIEKFFFGRVDAEGKSSVEIYSDFQFDTPGLHEGFQRLVGYMSVQKLRTPKGLGWLSGLRDGRDRNVRLILLQQYQQLYCAMWSDCVWQIADAIASPTKFIVSDHPVTAYNRGCFPGSQWCIGFNEPDIRWVGTHTYFPLSIDKILIMTNLSWVRNPYQDPRKEHPNQNFFHTTVFKLTDIQTYRSLSEQEVREINYITKMRALRYVAGAEQEWLYPERYLPTTHWNKLGNGLLLMPEPREIHMGGEVLVGYKGGRSEAWNEYGQRPWERGYKDKNRDAVESKTLQRFQAEFAAMQGPEFRGTSHQFHRGDDGPFVESDEIHQHYLELARRFRHRN